MDGLQDITKTKPIIEVHAQGGLGQGAGATSDFLRLLLEHFAAKEHVSQAMDVLSSLFPVKSASPAERDTPPERPEPKEPATPSERLEPLRHRTRDELPEPPPEPECPPDTAGHSKQPPEQPTSAPDEDGSKPRPPDIPEADAPADDRAPRPESPLEEPAQPAEDTAAKTDRQQMPPQIEPDEPGKPVATNEPSADDTTKLLAAEQPTPNASTSPPTPDAEKAEAEEPEPIQQPKPTVPEPEPIPAQPEQPDPDDLADKQIAGKDEPSEPEAQAPSDHVPRHPAQHHGGGEHVSVADVPGVSAHNAPLIDAEAVDRVVGVSDGLSTASSLSATIPADAVTAVASSMGADGSSTDGGQTGPQAQSATSYAQAAAAAAGTEAAERLDTVFKQVLSTSRLPLDMQKRIELARSIGRQVIRSALVSVRDGRTHVTLQLKPPSLGTVRMQLMGEGKTVTARLTVDNPLVRQAVEQHVQQLRSVLRDEGFQLQRFEVAVRSDGGSNPWASNHAREGGGHGPGRWASADDEAYAEQNQTPLDETAAAAAAVHDGAVDYLA